MLVPDLIYCAGGNPAFRAVAAECGWLNGGRLPDTVYGGLLYFADQDRHAPDRKAYMRALACHRPDMATVLDWEREDQWPEVLDWALEAAQFVRRLVIVPKVPRTVCLVPDRIGGAAVVLGYSVPTRYGATAVPVWEFRHRPVHLFGGSPQRQLMLADCLRVVSLDGSMAQQQAIRGRHWSAQSGPKGHWRQLADGGDFRVEGIHLEAFRRSCRAIRRAWERVEAEQAPTS